MTRTVVCSLKPHGSVSSSVRAENFILIWLVNCLSSFLIYIQQTKILLLSKNCLSACKVLIVVFLFSCTGLYSIRFGMLEKLTKLMKICPSYFIKNDLVENLIVSVPSVDPLFIGEGFYFIFQWFNNYLSFIFIAMVTPNSLFPSENKIWRV